MNSSVATKYIIVSLKNSSVIRRRRIVLKSGITLKETVVKIDPTLNQSYERRIIYVKARSKIILVL